MDVAGCLPLLNTGIRARRIPKWFKRADFWLPLLLPLVIVLPTINFMLPATHDYVDEIYQPLAALKFFKTFGHAFDKYGPAPNFLLAPGYAISMLYWKLTGSFGHPSEDYPYGFTAPFEQMSTLILQGRIIFLLLGLACFGTLLASLELLTEIRTAIVAAFLICIGTNYAILYSLPTPRPDSAMVSFAAISLALYFRIVFRGLTRRRAVLLSIFATLAVSSKELAAGLFVLPYIGLMIQSRKSREARVTMLISVAVGLGTYALLNVVYAPTTWMHRMRFWATGPGIDPEVWGSGSSNRLALIAKGLLNNLGPAGTPVVAFALIALLVARPKHWKMCLLPLPSYLLIGATQIAYGGDRFYTLVALALVAPVAMGLTVIANSLRTPGLRPMAAGVAALCVACNFIFSSFVWLIIHSTFEYQMEQHVIRHVSPQEKVFPLVLYPLNKGASRLEHFGYRVETRSVQNLQRHFVNPPQWIYVAEGKLRFIDQARHSAARAKMLRDEAGFDASDWPGMEALGYSRAAELLPPIPSWFCFTWMPAVDEWRHRRKVLVYGLNPTEPIPRIP